MVLFNSKMKTVVLRFEITLEIGPKIKSDEVLESVTLSVRKFTRDYL